MASDAPHKQEFRIRDLSTRSVTLFPTRAQIIRDIKEVTLHPGPNQIVIDGLAPTVNEHSIKVEGTGSATISEVTVDLLPNREVYEDIYPSDSDDDDSDDDEESEAEVEAMKEIDEKLKQLNVTLLQEQEKINSATNRLQICEYFGQSVASKRPESSDLDTLIQTYNEERTKIFRDHETATAAAEKVKSQITKTEKEKMKLAKALVKANEKAEKEKAKAKEKKLRKKAEIYKEKQRIKAERELFWPKKVYRVTINLEPSSMTPGSSRRSSIDGDTIVNLATSDFHEPTKAPLKTGEISLSVSYITYSASWSPRYDLSLNTVKCTGTLEYGADLKNTTSETWRDAKVILSTSQTTFSGLSESIPTLQPWHVRLLKGGRGKDSALFSQHELEAKQKEWSQSTGEATQKPRHEIFGRDSSSQDAYYVEQSRRLESKKEQRQVQVTSLFGASQPQAAAAFGSGVQNRGGLFGGSVQAQYYAPPERSSMAMSKKSKNYRSSRRDIESKEEEDESEDDEDMGFGLFDDGVAGPGAGPQSLTFEQGAWEETGLTTTYEAGTKTLSPTNSTTKYKIANIHFKNIIFSHIVVGKLRQVAFLKAKLRNASQITLLKGPLGLTLDGSFLGQASFPRCSAGEIITLPLGVDPTINITYPKPTVRRSQTGIFSKEDSNVFTRSVMIVNTKHNSAVELTVLDQIPVSEDERLKIDIVNPRGLKLGGDRVATGASASGISNTVAHPAPGGTVKGAAKDVRASVYSTTDNGQGASGAKWGSAIASAKKGGEVAWNVKLNPGQGVKLVLEYEATFPGGEVMVGI